MILGAAPVFAEEEVKVEETKEINYKEAYLQNVVAAKEAAVKEAEAKLEAAKKAVAEDLNVVAAKATLDTKVAAQEKAQKAYDKALADADKAVKDTIKKILGEGELDLTAPTQNVAYKAVAEAKKVVADKTAEVANKEVDLVSAKAKYTKDVKAAKEVFEASTKDDTAKNTYTNAIKKAEGELAEVEAAVTVAKAMLKLANEELTKKEEELKKAINFIDGQLDLAGDQFSAETEIKAGDGAQLVYWLQHNYPAYYQHVYNLDVTKQAVIGAKAMYEAALKASPKNAGVLEATAALEAAKAELEAAKAELNAAKAGVEEKPEVVVDN